MLLTPELRGRLARLELALKRRLPSLLRGDRKSAQRKGISLEFSDFRNYVLGDDVRHLDWAAYGRLDQLVVKLYHDEEDLEVRILVDESASMAHGDGEKLLLARTLALALSWVGFARGHRVTVARLGETPEVRRFGRDRGSVPSLARFLESSMARCTLPPSELCRRLASKEPPRGVIVFLSDLLDPAGPVEIVRPLLRHDTEVFVIQVLSEEDLSPRLEGECALIDSENGSKVEVFASEALLESYRRRVRSFVASCADSLRRYGASFAQVSTAMSLEEAVLKHLVREGILR